LHQFFRIGAISPDYPGPEQGRGRAAMSAQMTAFRERLARIEAGEGCTMTTVFVGGDLSFSYDPKGRRTRRTASKISNVAQVLSVPLAILSGVAGNLGQRYSDYILNGLPTVPESPEVDMAIVAVTSAAIAILLAHLLGLRDRSLLVPKLIGVAVGMIFLHNAVHVWPATFDAAFSPMWTSHMTAMTEPSSLFIRGISIRF
jgi:hypothetical protein